MMQKKICVWLLLGLLLLAACGEGETQEVETAVANPSPIASQPASEADIADEPAKVEPTPVGSLAPEPTDEPNPEPAGLGITAELDITNSQRTEAEGEQLAVTDDCFERLFGNGRFVLFQDGSLTYMPSDPTALSDCLLLDTTELSGEYEPSDEADFAYEMDDIDQFAGLENVEIDVDGTITGAEGTVRFRIFPASGEDRSRLQMIQADYLFNGAMAAVDTNEVVAELSLTEVAYITESFLGSQTEASIYVGNCLARLLNNGQMILYSDNRFELTIADAANLADCFAFANSATLTGTYTIDDGTFTANYDFDEPLLVQNGDAIIETFVNGFVGEQLPSGNFRGGFGFSILTSGDLGAGDVFYVVEGDVVAFTGEGGETVPALDLVYSVNEALAVFDEPILLPPPPNYQVGATSNTLSFGAVTKLSAAEAAADYQGYMSGLGWTLDETLTDGNLIRLGFLRNAEMATVSFRQALATTIEGFFQLSGEPWTDVPQIPLPAAAQLSQLFFSQDYELPVDSDRDAIAQLYEDLSTDELAAAGWTLENSSRSDATHLLSWSRPSGQSNVSISDVSSLNKVGVSYSFNTAVPAITVVHLVFSDVGSGQMEALANQFSLHGLSIEVNDREVDEATAVSAFCDGTADLISGSPALVTAARQQCPEGLVEFTVAQVPLAVVVNQENDWARSMTSAEAMAALTTAQTWADVNPAWPDTPILRAVPSTGTVVANVLVEELLGGDASALSSAANVLRFDTGFGVVWNGVSSDPGAIGFAPIDDVLANAEGVTAVQLDGLTMADANYPLQMPLVLVTRDSTLRDNLPLSALVGRTLLPDADVALELVGYLPVATATQQANEQAWLDAVGE